MCSSLCVQLMLAVLSVQCCCDEPEDQSARQEFGARLGWRDPVGDRR